MEPPPSSCECPCEVILKSELPEHTEPCCLQWTRLPLATDQWASDVQAPGLAIQVSPSSGELAAGSATHLEVQVYADSWGLYRDQILLQVENVEPIILNAWVEAVGAPLQFAIKPIDDGEAPVIWMSSTDARRTVRARNTSRTRLDVRAYLLQQHEHDDDCLPFRLYLRFLDTQPQFCSSDSYASDDDSASSKFSSSTASKEMDTTVELFLAPDYGIQCDTSFKVEPLLSVVEAGAYASWTLTMSPLYCELAADAVLLLRCVPIDSAGVGWYRPEPAPQRVCVRRTERAGRLQPAAPRDVRVKLCALHLPCHELLRVRKRFKIQNIGDGPLTLTAHTQSPWSIVKEEVAGCGCQLRRRTRLAEHQLYLEARSFTEVCVEVSVHSAAVCPECPGEGYAERTTTTTPLLFKDQHNVLLSVRLVLEIEFPVLHVEPAVIDFGFVTDGDTRKSYYTVRHTSRDQTIDVVIKWTGSEGFELWPRKLLLAPGVSERIYIQYTAKWCSGASAEGHIVVAAARSWCCGTAAGRARPERDARWMRGPHDYTDDGHLLPTDTTL